MAFIRTLATVALTAAIGCAALAPRSPALAQAPVFALIIRNHQFEPAELAIPAGQKIELHVKNMDATPEEFESASLRREKVVPGGREVTIYIGPLAPGRYEFFGDFNPATARGFIVAK